MNKKELDALFEKLRNPQTDEEIADYDQNLKSVREEIKQLRHFKQGAIQEMHEAEQHLGKALGYPYAGPEIGGDGKTFVVVPDPIGVLALQAAREIKRLRDRQQEIIATFRKLRKKDKHKAEALDICFARPDVKIVQVVKAGPNGWGIAEVTFELQSIEEIKALEK